MSRRIIEIGPNDTIPNGAVFLSTGSRKAKVVQKFEGGAQSISYVDEVVHYYEFDEVQAIVNEELAKRDGGTGIT
jgi:hypothetical protein